MSVRQTECRKSLHFLFYTFICLFSGIGVEPPSLMIELFSLQRQPTKLLTRALCSIVAGIWPGEMELNQEWFHLPVAILVWPWSTRGQVGIMGRGASLWILESRFCHLPSSDLGKLTDPLGTLVLPAFFYVLVCVHLREDHQKRPCALNEQKQLGGPASMKPGVQEAQESVRSSAFARKSTCETPKPTSQLGWALLMM